MSSGQRSFDGLRWMKRHPQVSRGCLSHLDLCHLCLTVLLLHCSKEKEEYDSKPEGTHQRTFLSCECTTFSLLSCWAVLPCSIPDNELLLPEAKETRRVCCHIPSSFLFLRVTTAHCEVRCKAGGASRRTRFHTHQATRYAGVYCQADSQYFCIFSLLAGTLCGRRTTQVLQVQDLS